MSEQAPISKAEFAADIKRIREVLYNDQPDVFSAISELLDVLEVYFCEHKWKTVLAGGDPTAAESAEKVTVCELCGLEA